jgi:hypothetical protein
MIFSLFATSKVWAQDEMDPQGPPPQAPPQEQPQAQGQQPAQTAVARLSAVHGQVSTMRGDAGQWNPGSVNTPVVPGDSVATADGSRAELQLDFANVLRLDQHTEAKLADLEQNKLQVQLASGLVDFTVTNGTQADAEIDTPNMGVHPLSPGTYRIQVTSPTETSLIVRKGEAEVLTNQGSVKVEAGQMIQIHGSDNPEYKIDAAPGGDDFDKWCRNRDREMQNSPSVAHTGPYYTGANDLDTYGQWNEVPDYGWCWTPQVDAGWVPYSAGYWGWEPYWGYTWISSEPWGWAPYHYGRWFMYGGAWRWWPAVGYFGSRPIWAPAYVSFFGFGRGIGVGFGFGFGSVGWLALGPRDIFHPWWGAGRAFAAMSFANMHGAGFVRPGGPAYGSNLERAMTDARIRGAVRNVSAQDFASGRMGRSMPVNEGMLREASMMRGGLPVSPSRSAFSGRGAGGFSRSAASSQHFFSRSAAPAGRVSSFGTGARTNSVAGGGGSGWQHYSGAGSNQSARWPAGVNTGTHGAGSSQPGWQRYASPSPYSNRSGAGTANQARNYSYAGAGSVNRYGGGAYGRGSYGGGAYGGASRPPMNLNRPIMQQRAPSGGNYGGGRTYSAPSGGAHSAPSGGGHSYGGGGGGGGGHAGGGGHGGRR